MATIWSFLTCDEVNVKLLRPLLYQKSYPTLDLRRPTKFHPKTLLMGSFLKSLGLYLPTSNWSLWWAEDPSIQST